MNKSKKAKIRPVILSGGFEQRLLPVAFDHCPRQFTRSADKESLFYSTLKRVSDRNIYAPPLIIGNIEHIFFILADLGRLEITDAKVFLEPLGRKTATAALIAALSEDQFDMLHLVLPSSHNITDEANFHDAVSKAAIEATFGNIVLFGITPEGPYTDYSYIVPGQNIENSPAKKIGVFTENPDETFARVLINQEALWHSEMFLYEPEVLCRAAMDVIPEHYRNCETAVENAQHERKCTLLRQEDYTAMESYSLDTLIIRQTKSAVVLPCSISRTYVGTWESITAMSKQLSSL